MPSIGIMHSGTQGNQDAYINAFQRTLEQQGFINGQNQFQIYGPCYGRNNPQTMANCAATLVAQNVDVLVAAGGTRSAQIASQTTQQIPIVFTSVAFPVRPASNMTGICAQTAELDRKRLQLLMELMPGQTKFGLLYNSDRFPQAAQNTQLIDLNNAAVALGLQPHSARDVGNGAGGDPNLIAPAFAAWPAEAQPIRAAVVAADPFFNNHRQAVITAANDQNTPVAAVHQWREFVNAGGLMSLGTNLEEAYRLAAVYTARLLRKEKQPRDLPILTLTKFDLAVNLTTARNIGITVPESILVRADHVVP
jgi:putative tryptophan/tyrosine transport system substrate-binding protein